MKMNLLSELLDLCETPTAGLKLGAFLFDEKKKTIITKIAGKTYEYAVNDPKLSPEELYKSVVGVAKHSQGRALAFLKKHATGKVMNESIAEAQQINQQFVKKVMQACNDLDDPTRLAVTSALDYAMIHAQDDDFIKAYGTVTSNVLLGKEDDQS